MISPGIWTGNKMFGPYNVIPQSQTLSIIPVQVDLVLGNKKRDELSFTPFHLINLCITTQLLHRLDSIP
jgi:hypothetical protein